MTTGDGAQGGDKGKDSPSAASTQVEVRTVREFGGPNTWPMLTRTNYGEWAVHMKWKLRARKWWCTVDPGGAGEDAEVGVMEALLASTPAEYHETLGAKATAKEAWEMLATMRVGSERAKKAKAQQLRREFEELKFSQLHLQQQQQQLLQFSPR